MIHKECNVKQENREKRNAVKEAFKRLLYVIVCIVGVLLLLILIVPAFFRVVAGDSMAQQEKEIAALEEYYQNGDYESMSGYYRKIGKSGGDYEKYKRICELYEDMNRGMEALEKIEEYEAVETEYLQECLKMCMSTLAEIDDMESLGFPYGEDEGAMYIKHKYTEALKKYMLLTPDEIATAASSYVDDKTDYMELAEIAVQRIEEQNH